MARPAAPPIGFTLAQTARRVSRAFDAALAEAGGSLPVWWILLSLRANPSANQRAIASAAGIRSATLTHHLNAMEAEGLLTRRRDSTDRREHVVELTAAGEARFDRLRAAAMAFDRKLRAGFSEPQIGELRTLLERLAANSGAERG